MYLLVTERCKSLFRIIYLYPLPLISAGDIELSTNLSSYMQSVICEQYTEAFAIDLRNYDRLVTRRHASTGRFIAQNALLKLENRAQRFSNIPFLQIVSDKFARLLTDYRRSRRQRDEK